MSTEYGVKREFCGVVYGASGFSSHEDALMNVHQRAFDNGDWSPRELRGKWWQFWRPTEHTDIEKAFLGEPQ